MRIRIDNTTAVHYVNAMGGVVSKNCNLLSKKVWKWCISRQIWLSASHIPGINNTTADEASRNFIDKTEWMLHKTIFIKLTEVFGLPDIDLFASRLNCQCTK